MCLDTVSKRTKHYKVGWKIFKKDYGQKGRLWGWMIGPPSKYRNGYKKGVWLKDVIKGIILTSNLDEYPKGFHFYEKRKDAQYDCSGYPNVICKVKVRNVVASGLQTGCRVGVAKEMLILEERK